MEEPLCLVFGPFRFDLRDERLWRGRDVIHVHPKTLAVLRALVAQAGQLLTKDALFAGVWPETVVSEAVLTVAIRELRRALGDQARHPQFIETVYGRGYRFIAPINTPMAPGASGMEEAPRHGRSPPFSRPPHFVGRDAALAQLAQWWRLARQGRRQVGVITGEPGIGKTALVDTFVAHMAGMEGIWIGRGQCLDHYGAGEAYLPILEALGRLGRGPEGEQLVTVLRQYAPSWLVQMPGLLPPSAWESLQHIAGGATQPRMLRELTEALDVLTTERPLVLILEDLHWSDVSTLAWLAYVARRPDPARLLLLGTYRPVDATVSAHPIRTVMTELYQHQQAVELPLDYLSADDVAAYCRQRWRGTWLSAEVTHVLYQRTRGHPLLLVTIVDEMRHRGLLREDATGVDVSQVLEMIRSALPESLRQMIEQQLHHVRPQDQRVLEAASIAGRTFSAAAIAAVVDQPTEDLEARLGVLTHHGQFIRSRGLEEWPDRTVAAGYEFIHDLYRDILYDQISPSRQRRWHLQIGVRKEQGYGARAREIAAELAVHFERGGDARRALRYLQHAADNALGRAAPADAVTHLTNALALLAAQPDTPECTRQELAIQIRLGTALRITKGHAAPDTGHAWVRAWELARRGGDTPQRLVALGGLIGFYQNRGELQTARALAEQRLSLARRQRDRAHRVQASAEIGQLMFFLGAFGPARAHLEHAIALSASQPDHVLTGREARDHRITALGYLAFTLWMLGYPDQALTRLQDMLIQAQELSYAFSWARALLRAAVLHRYRREVRAAQGRAEVFMTIVTEQGFEHYVGGAMLEQGWALAAQGQDEQGMAQMHQGLAALQATGTELLVAEYLVLLAEAYGRIGQAEEGRRRLAEALARVDAAGEHYYAAEGSRLQGELRRQSTPDEPEAECCFHQALAVAHRQQAKSLELRAAMSLCRLWQQQGKRAEARALLAPIYGWFTEGFDTADLKEAKALLEELS
jgi:predicted ATPase/DNA-binding winged helix-turn-helix (wHTH) protein